METIREVIVESGTIILNGKEIYTDTEKIIDEFLKKLYKYLDISYSKFYKMDKLSKLGILCSEILLDGYNELKDTDTLALIFANKTASMNTDVNYQLSIEEIPSPSLFVYTLPNIVIGEICIKHKLYGEHMFLVQEQYNEEQIMQYTQALFMSTNTQFAITAWIEITSEYIYNVQMKLIKK